MKMHGLFKIGLLVLITSLVVGCQATRRTLNFDTTAQLKLTAFEDVNPDRDNRSSPIVIRVFKLADARQFKREDFLNLYENADERLGNDLLDTVILKELAPGEERIELLELTPEVRYLGLMAEYVRYQDANAILVLPIEDHNKNKFEVDVRHLTLSDKNAPSPRHASYGYNDARRDANQLRRDRDMIESEIDRYKK
ncbi:hypothetical protein R50073_30100 [Maricurvus nonylphenolicus]|uniref:type VI secretion system lipoprotein TssJ n=1 Tax=Maricurvus nonylphenolicus TaxID=1008307 RepID=UPI0036F292D0